MIYVAFSLAFVAFLVAWRSEVNSRERIKELQNRLVLTSAEREHWKKAEEQSQAKRGQLLAQYRQLQLDYSELDAAHDAMQGEVLRAVGMEEGPDVPLEELDAPVDAQEAEDMLVASILDELVTVVDDEDDEEGETDGTDREAAG